MTARLACCLLALAVSAAPVPSAAAAAPPDPARSGPVPPASHWPQFRGPRGAASLDGAGLPSAWSAQRNVRWRTAIPGHGWSSPIVWGERVFVTTAVSEGEFKEPTAGIFGNGTIYRMLREGKTPQQASAFVRERDTELPEETDAVSWRLYCLDAASGEILWAQEPHRGKPPLGRHRKNTWASETPVTDGERVYALFGNLGVWAYTLDGDPVWSHRLEPRAVYLDFGTGASPAVDDRHVYVVNDNDEGAYLVALDKRTGEVRWRVERGSGQLNSAWATPYLWQTPDGAELVAPGASKVLAYDPADGAVLWELYRWSAVATPTPFAAGELLVLSGGSVSEPMRPLMAIRPGARGDLTFEGSEPGAHVAWFDPRGGSYIPTPVAYGERLYALYDKGFLATYRLADGERLSMQRVGGGRSTFSASPWAADGKIYALSEDGETFVFEAGDQPRLLHTNDLDEMALATPALTPLGLFLRTDGHLLRISGDPAASAAPAGSP
jgi:outer membrane protein assembly factor BamB